jgi:hypothetical protein
MNDLDRYTNKIYEYLYNETSHLDLFQLSTSDEDNEGEINNSIDLYFNNKQILEIIITAYLNQDDDGEFNDPDDITSIEFSLYLEHDNRYEHFRNFTDCFNVLKEIINDYKKEDINDFDITQDGNIIDILTHYPVFNKNNYNIYVDRILSTKGYLYKYIIKDLLNKDIFKKYQYLEHANKFDLI